MAAYTVALTESLVTLDAYSAIMPTWISTTTESISTSESLVKRFTAVRQTLDVTGITSVGGAPRGAAGLPLLFTSGVNAEWIDRQTAVDRTTLDTITSSDSANDQQSPVRNLTEILVPEDAVTLRQRMLRVISDTVAIGDETAAYQRGSARNIPVSLTTTDAGTRSAGHPRVTSDTTQTDDAVGFGQGPARYWIEKIGIRDGNFDRVVAFVRVPDDDSPPPVGPPVPPLSGNLCPNPSFEYDTPADIGDGVPAAWVDHLNFTTAGGFLAVWLKTSPQTPYGLNSMTLLPDGVTDSQGAECPLDGTFASGTLYTFSIYLQGDVGGEEVTLLFGTAADYNDNYDIVLTSDWARYDVNWTPVGDCTGVSVAIQFLGAGPPQTDGGDGVWCDAAMVTEGELIDYFDGDTPDYSWTGTPGDSTSVSTDLLLIPRIRPSETLLVGEILDRQITVQRNPIEHGTFSEVLHRVVGIPGDPPTPGYLRTVTETLSPDDDIAILSNKPRAITETLVTADEFTLVQMIQSIMGYIWVDDAGNVIADLPDWGWVLIEDPHAGNTLNVVPVPTVHANLTREK